MKKNSDITPAVTAVMHRDLTPTKTSVRTDTAKTSVLKKTRNSGIIGNSTDMISDTNNGALRNATAIKASGAMASKKIFGNYFGGKGSEGVAQTIINHFPEHTVYLEYFVGAGSVYRKKTPAFYQYGFDIDKTVIAAWREKFPEADVFEMNILEHLDYPFYRWNELDPKQILIYLDPPYPHSSRSSSHRYKHELTDADHKTLLKWALKSKYNIVISTYPNALYATMLAKWYRTDYYSVDRRGKKRLEHLYFNFEKPTVLHQYNHLGDNYRERENISRKIKRWKNKFEKLPLVVRNGILSELQKVK